MRLDKFRDGLSILALYYDKPEGFQGGCEHDQFYAYATDRPLSPDDVEKMAALGWFQEGAYTGEDEDWGPKHYDAKESWTAYF